MNQNMPENSTSKSPNNNSSAETDIAHDVSKIDIDPDSISEDKWMIRDCQVYKDEYKECTSFRGRFQQYFIYGESLDCNQWKKDYNNCCKWEDSKDLKAANSLIKSERARRLERLRAHYRNDTWKQRDGPPPDWDKPLPEWMVKRDENTFLAVKAKEMKEGKENIEKSFCSIM